MTLTPEQIAAWKEHANIAYARTPAAMWLADAVLQLAGEVERLRARISRLATGIHDGPDGCPTYYDGCNCLDETKVHAIERANKLDEQVERLVAEVRAEAGGMEHSGFCLSMVGDAELGGLCDCCLGRLRAIADRQGRKP